METSNGNEKIMEAFDAQKARDVLERVGKFLGILIRENLVKDAPFLEEGELENESDLADDVYDLLHTPPRNCDRFDDFESARDEWWKTEVLPRVEGVVGGAEPLFEAWLFFPAVKQN